jgi:hypothetical protein
MATKGTSSTKLSKNTDGYRAIFDKVRELWDQYGSDITVWPEAKEVYEELESSMMPYGDHHNIRSAKLRNCYNKLTKEIFISHGKVIYHLLFVYCKEMLNTYLSQIDIISLLLAVVHRVAPSRSFASS